MLNNNIFINYMENIIDQLEEKFLEIRNVFTENENLCLEISTKVNKIKEMYLDFMGDNDKQILIFGLDTLHFQYKFFNKELLHINEYKVLLSNRIYCEYFKLYKLIQEYCLITNKEEKCEDTNNLKISVENYDDLNPDQEFTFENISKLNEANIKLINSLLQIYKQKSSILKDYELKNSFGINIDNFVFGFSHNTILIKEKILLFEKYLIFFYDIHSKLLNRFLTKCKLLYGQMMHDIKFDDKKNDPNEKQQKKFLKRIKRESGVDENIIKAIEKSISINEDTDSDSVYSPVFKNPKSLDMIPSPESKVFFTIDDSNNIIDEIDTSYNVEDICNNSILINDKNTDLSSNLILDNSSQVIS